jgi:NAD(P)-dependent dehydrogenase (short-subunit alcohol dehydrogenase family)
MTPPREHAGRTAMVTGGASGIGLQIAQDLAARGAAVCIVDRNADAARDAVASLQAVGAQAGAYVVDLADAEATRQTLAQVLQQVGTVDILVNNAGIVATVPATDVTLSLWQTTLAVNLTAPMVLTQGVLPGMQAKGWGRVVNVSSISGVRAGTGRLAYGTSKAALIAMTGQFAIESAQWGVTVNAIAPGFVDTPMLRSLHGSSRTSTFTDVCPMGRLCTPEEVSQAVMFFASAQSAFITGQTLGIDGGYLASGLFNRKLFEIPAATPAAP